MPRADAANYRLYSLWEFSGISSGQERVDCET